ncbi:carboxymuconolactone decarboxylase family protein [Acidobacteriia bacterium AH_259_A11_L15]|nr:carboxymuconolactone decarboxylase family protein [Acidobacteriia bacterium AH_259_A11_L15]
MNKESYRRGLKLFRQMAGPAAEEIRRHWRGLAPDFERYVLGFLAGEIWTRPLLDLRTRSLVTIAALAATGRQQGLELNVRMALHNGASRDEVVETLLHLAPYIGFPTVWDALTLASRVFGEFAPRVRRPHRGPRRRRRRSRSTRK